MSSAASVSDPPYQLAPLAGGKLPLVIQPRGDDDAGHLADWLGQRPGEVQRLLVQHGALLLRGFQVGSAAAFERVARAIAPVLKNDYLGTSPRNALTDYVFSASELPPFYPIPQHIEMSFVKQPPSRLFFWCELPNGGEGGETPLVDFRRVLADLDPAVRARFEQRGVTNIRNYAGPPVPGHSGARRDLWKLKRWDEMFLTTDHDAVLAKARANGFEPSFGKGDRLRLINTQPATKAHPTTGEMVWFNHSQVFHLSAAAGEYRRIAGKSAALSERIRYRALAAFARAMVALKRLQPAETQAMHCSYGDGSPIPDADMERVRDAIWKNLVVFRWQRGDVVAIDNHAVSHGRMPYHGPRKIAAAWA